MGFFSRLPLGGGGRNFLIGGGKKKKKKNKKKKNNKKKKFVLFFSLATKTASDRKEQTKSFRYKAMVKSYGAGPGS